MPRIRRIEPHERCFIARRRAGLRQTDVARSLTRSRRWVGLMEKGHEDATELVEWWGE